MKSKLFLTRKSRKAVRVKRSPKRSPSSSSRSKSSSKSSKSSSKRSPSSRKSKINKKGLDKSIKLLKSILQKQTVNMTSIRQSATKLNELPTTTHKVEAAVADLEQAASALTKTSSDVAAADAAVNQAVLKAINDKGNLKLQQDLLRTQDELKNKVAEAELSALEVQLKETALDDAGKAQPPEAQGFFKTLKRGVRNLYKNHSKKIAAAILITGAAVLAYKNQDALKTMWNARGQDVGEVPGEEPEFMKMGFTPDPNAEMFAAENAYEIPVAAAVPNPYEIPEFMQEEPGFTVLPPERVGVFGKVQDKGAEVYNALADKGHAVKETVVANVAAVTEVTGKAISDATSAAATATTAAKEAVHAAAVATKKSLADNTDAAKAAAAELARQAAEKTVALATSTVNTVKAVKKAGAAAVSATFSGAKGVADTAAARTAQLAADAVASAAAAVSALGNKFAFWRGGTRKYIKKISSNINVGPYKNKPIVRGFKKYNRRNSIANQ